YLLNTKVFNGRNIQSKPVQCNWYSKIRGFIDYGYIKEKGASAKHDDDRQHALPRQGKDG
ncbi:MAG: hypothetical protein AB7E59_09275, partial [Pusillimonas sp.]